MPDPEADLALILGAIRGAGDIALRFIGPEAKVWHKEDGAGPVTEADYAVNDHLLRTLRSDRPDYGWLSEETEDDRARLEAETVFIVDPIDGTRSFMEGSRTWAHSVAVVHKGRPVAGAIYLPQRGLLFSAAKDAGAWLGDERLTARQGTDLSRAEVLATKPNLRAQFWRGEAPRFERAHRPSLAYRMALVGQGRFDGMITFRPTWEWDIAAGALIAAEAGARVTDRSGTPLRFNAPDPRTHGVIAAGPALHDVLVAAHIPTA